MASNISQVRTIYLDLFVSELVNEEHNGDMIFMNVPKENIPSTICPLDNELPLVIMSDKF
jgi:hypothetical protein